MSLSEYDRMLLERCLQGTPRAWEDFVDRFLGLVVHVVGHTAKSRNFSLDAASQEDLVSDVFLTLIENDFAVLRRFRRQCSLATYLAVIARRVVVRKLAQMQMHRSIPLEDAKPPISNAPAVEDRIENREHVEKILLRLDGRDAQIVRMYHLEGKSYGEISSKMGLSENSIGPVLSRARQALRDE